MASSDEDLLPPPLLPIKPPPHPGLTRESRGEKERERSAELVGDDLRREQANVVPAPSSTSEMTCDDNRNFDLPPGYLQALLAKVRALGLMTSRGVSAEALGRSPPLPTEAKGPRLSREGPELGAVHRNPASGGYAGAAASFPVAAPAALLFNAPTALDIFALHHNPIILAIRAYQFDLLQKQVLSEQLAFTAPPIVCM